MRPQEMDIETMLRRLHLPTVRRLCRELEQRAGSEQMSYCDYLSVLIAAYAGAFRPLSPVQVVH